MPRKSKLDAASPEASTPKGKGASKALVEEIVIQYGNAEWNLAALKEKAIVDYVAKGHRRGRIAKLTLYVKPEERKVYYVMNDKTTGSVDFDTPAKEETVQ